MSELFPVVVDLEANAARLAATFATQPDREHAQWAEAMVPVHGTPKDAAINIIASGKILPYTEIQRTPNNGVPSPYLTDDLDVKLGQDKYTFFNVGKVDPLEVAPIYFCAKPSLITRESSYVAMHDIARLGALVSPQARALYQIYRPDVDVAARNADATEKFFSSLMTGKAFHAVFARFIATNYPHISKDMEYWRDVTYPGESLDISMVGPEATSNVWPGPQLQVLGSVSLSEVCALVITDPEIKELPGTDELVNIPIARAHHWAEHYKESIGPYTSDNPIEQGFNRSLYTNLVLRDLALRNIQAQRSTSS